MTQSVEQTENNKHAWVVHHPRHRIAVGVTPSVIQQTTNVEGISKGCVNRREVLTRTGSNQPMQRETIREEQSSKERRGREKANVRRSLTTCLFHDLIQMKAACACCSPPATLPLAMRVTLICFHHGDDSSVR